MPMIRLRIPTNDGLTNLEEYNSGTNPTVNDWEGPVTAVSALFTVKTSQLDFPVLADTDGDGMPDWWESKYGLDPAKNDAAADKDEDGVSATLTNTQVVPHLTQINAWENTQRSLRSLL